MESGLILFLRYTADELPSNDNNKSRVAVKLQRTDLNVVTADELGPGDTFGESCMLDEHRGLRGSSRTLNASEEGDGLSRGCDREGQDHLVGARIGASVSAAGKSMETYQVLEVRDDLCI